MKAFVNADIFSHGRVFEDHALLVDGGKVLDIAERSQLPKKSEVIDLKGQNLAPGFVDLQVNGGGGIFFNEDQTPTSIATALRAHRKLGTTAIFPTIFTRPQAAMEALLEGVIHLRNRGERGLAGIHFEGPAIESSKAGVHDRAQIRTLDHELVSLYKRSAAELPTLVTLAPEHVDDAQIAELRAAGVLVFAGHTNADYSRMNSAFDAGLQGGTHLFNAMGGLGSREPGTVGALLASDAAYATIIADGHHVHWASLKIAWRAKRLGRTFCVTDAMPCVGSTSTEFHIGDLKVHVRNGRCETDDGTLAGSALDMATAVRNLVQQVGIPLPEALRMANSYPAAFASLTGYGKLESGSDADFIVFNNQVQISGVYVSGLQVQV